MIGIIMATEMEAEPFLRKGVTKEPEHPFPVYRTDGFVLIVSGIGKVNAALAVAYGYSVLGLGSFVNAGAAGALHGDGAVGDIFHVDRVCDADRPSIIKREPRFLIPSLMSGYAVKSLVTSDRPMVADDERRAVSGLGYLADMEGAGFVQACARFSCEGYVVKVITDVPGHGDTDIIANVKATRDALYAHVVDALVTGPLGKS